MTKVQDVIAAMETIAPPQLALPGDPIGLHAGDPGRRVARLTLSLDASLAALSEAARSKADMLVVHHPRFYRGLSTLAETDLSGRRAAAIARAGLAVYSAHTNLDLAEGGTNDLLAEAAGLIAPAIVKPEISERLLKLAVFVPATHVEGVLRALCAAGAGAIGKYSDCTFRTRGIGTFRGGKETHPFIGKPGVFEEADEYRLETVFGEFSAAAVLAAMKRAHPYEEVAYDLHPLSGQARSFGLGRVGELARREALRALAARIAAATASPMTQYHGKAGLRVRRVAVWAGGGVDVKAVLASGAEALIAGELGYHDLEGLAERGVAAITLGHGPSEELVLRPLAARLGRLLPGVKVGVSKKGWLSMANVDR